MASSSSSTCSIWATLLIILMTTITTQNMASAANTNMNDHLELAWGDGRAKMLNNAQLLTLSLDQTSGSGFQSKDWYLFGKIDMQIKLGPGNSADTVTTYYLHSQGDSNQDEIDVEFLGNVSGQPYKLHAMFIHKERLTRSSSSISGLTQPPVSTLTPFSGVPNASLDNTPIREFKNSESIGVAYPKSKPMRMYSKLWNVDDWATQGGRVKTEWSKAPFTASYRNYRTDACVSNSGSSWSSCKGSNSRGWSGSSSWWLNKELDNTSQERMMRVQKN